MTTRPPAPGDPGQRAGDPGQPAGDPGQRAGDPGQRAGDPGQPAGDPGRLDAQRSGSATLGALVLDRFRDYVHWAAKVPGDTPLYPGGSHDPGT
ncbi:MAG: hypothetical protein ABSB01_04910 [Streptosporangiaceae bacterium]